MIRIVVDESVTEQLRHVVEPCGLFDAAGNKLGDFTPEFVGYECPYSEEELRQAEQEKGGRPLKEILADLEGQK